MEKVKRLYVLSIDSMFSEDFEFMKTLPNIGPFVKEASRIIRVRAVYPSLTYVCHTCMSTGVWPDKHHVHHNEIFMPGAEHPVWYYYRDRYAGVKTVMELAKEHGYTVGSLWWPATGNLNVDWVMDEIWSYTGGPEEDYEQMAKSSTKEYLDEVWPLIEPIFKHNKHPENDYVNNIALCEMIRRKKPEVIFQHVAYLDNLRHKKGIYAPEIYSMAWPHHDKLFGDALAALKDIGELENTTIIITSDHGQTPVREMVSPNTLFVRDGLIKIDKDGKLVDWDAFFFSAGHSCHIHLKKPEDTVLEEKVLKMLHRYKDTGELSIERIFSKREAEEEYHLTGDFTYIIEPTEGIAFHNRLTGDLVAKADNTDYKYSVATHGHLPEKGPQPTFFLGGANVKKGVVVESARLIDEAPTIAALLGFKMDNVDGRVIDELLI